ASFEVAHDRIVEVLTDVAPWVDSWEELTELDLSGRKLESVVRLKEFAPRLEKVRLDRNALSYLTGLPAGLRLLTLSGNRVPSIVSFGHLRSLETLDLSGNEVDDLSSLDCLMHLRHLRADANGISDVRGIERLEHLHSLSLRGNKLVSLDLSKTSWRRLSHLDVAHNALTSIKGLWHCKHLKTLDVGSNDLSLLDLGTGLMPRLRSLRVSNNSRLERLDVLPAARSLRTLFADFCALEKIDHLGALDKLEELSVRQQLTKPSKAPAGLHNVFGATPRLPNTSLSACSFNNVAYLELSACQLTAIPPNLAVLFPNLHQLVLDHNLFTRLPPSRSNGKSNGGGLAALSRLKRVSLVGCRIKSTRNLIEAFEGCDQLAVLDARMNPATLGLYPPVLASPLISASISPSPAFLAPMPNAETLRPDTIEGEMAQKQKERAEEERGRWEKSFWHKVHPRPEEDGDDSRGTEQHDDEDADETIKPAKQHDARFSRTLPAQLAMRRLLHRGTLGMVCPALQWLDGLQITDAEVNEAERVL
ncbi:L domain-like protein, partial [Jaminaea rosea]